MARIRKVKDKKIRKEFIEHRFKEVKSEDKLIEIEKEREQEKNHGESFDEFTESGETRRTAPVLQQEERTQEINLEDTVGTAPSVKEEQDDLYVARTTTEKGYGQEDYARRDYNIERKEEARPTLFLDEAARETRENIIRNTAVARQESQDVRIPEAWRGADMREPIGVRDYENIEEMAREAAKLTKEKPARRRVD